MALTGEYNRRVVLKKPTSSVNNEGGITNTWTNEIATWAKIKKSSLTSSQYRTTEGGATALIDSDIVEIRYAADRLFVDKNWLINYGGKDHVIHSINAETKTEVVFIVKAKV